MSEQLFRCCYCEKLTPLIMKQDKLGDSVQHNYAQCNHCKGKVTHSYTNKHIRGLLFRQRNTKPGKKKEALAEQILNEMDVLKAQYE
ncbi:hypothetical protein IGI39_004002 [Enterococcus sp. AZ135]|uniref:hypothetical protein n=1 Tax=unclassified Enterococcus TaxID=2608891 RepID=UPI003F248AA2